MMMTEWSQDGRVYCGATNAMATRFEIALHGKPEMYLRSVAEECFAEIHRIEAQLSIYREESEIREVNVYGAARAVPVDPRVMTLLLQAQEISATTFGAFDISIAPLVKAWGFMGSTGSLPEESAVEAALAISGMHHIRLDAENHTVQFDRDGVMIDLGAIGKGYAVDMISELVRDHEIPGALIHGGTSSISAIGLNSEDSPWNIAIRNPNGSEETLTTLALVDTTLSISAVHGKSFADGSISYGHVIDPRSGRPVQGNLLAAVVGPSATLGDALSTALLVAGTDIFRVFSQHYPEVQALLLCNSQEGERVIQLHGL